MLILYDINHNKIQGLINYKEPKLERTLDGEEVLSFLYPQSDSKYDLIQEEGYIRTKDNEYVIKEKNIGDNYTEIICKVNIEDLKGNPINHFETVDKTPEEASNLALVGTGWTVISDVVKRRTVRKSNCNSYDIFQEIRSTFNSDLKFDAVNKIVYIFEQRGSDKGAYFIEELNLKELHVQSNSYDFYTRLIPIGKDGLKITEVNDGNDFLENYQYSTKITTAYWEDNRYTDAESLKEDGELKLEYISKPTRAYSCKILDLAKVSDKYKNILDYDLGDTITLISKSKKVKEKQRIVKIIEYLNEPEKNQIEIANKLISLEELQERFINSADTVENITTHSGEILGSKVDGIDWSKLQNVHITIADVQDLSAVVIRVGELEANSATITDLNAISANINNLNVSKADVTELTAATGRITTLESDNASINYLLAGNIGAENIKAGAIATRSAIIADGAIGSAQISDLDVAKLNSGVFSTAKFTVIGTNGRLKIENNTLQVFDGITNLYERVALGDIDGDGTKYGLRVRGGDGETVLLDENGVTKEGFTDGYNKVDNGSLNGAKLDIATVVTEINNGDTHIEGSKIVLDNKTLDIEIADIKINVNYKVEIISTNGNVFKGEDYTTTLIARVYKGTEDLTDTLDANRFRWTRISDNNEDDLIWNTAHFGGTKQITVNQNDIKQRATFQCVILDENLN